MPHPDFDVLEELDALTAASLNTPLAAVEDAINDVEEAAVQRRGLRKEHLPSLVDAAAATGFDAQTVRHYTSTIAVYDNLYPGFSVNNVAGVGPGLGGTGWAILSHGGATASLSWPPYATAPHQVGNANAQVMAGLLVLMNAELVSTRDDGVALTTGNAPTTVAFAATFALGIKFNGDATTYVIPVTERFLCGNFNDDPSTGRVARETWQDAAIRALITPETLLGATNGTKAGTTIDASEITGIYGLVAFTRTDGAPMVGNPEVKIRHFELSVLPIFAETLA